MYELFVFRNTRRSRSARYCAGASDHDSARSSIKVEGVDATARGRYPACIHEHVANVDFASIGVRTEGPFLLPQCDRRCGAPICDWLLFRPHVGLDNENTD